MSQVQREQKNQEPVYLLSDENDDLADILVELQTHLTGNVMLDGYYVPRYGLLSLKAQHTPMFVYDHPALKKVTNTAFTDGVHIFVCADFMRQLAKEEEATNFNEEGLNPLMLHELMHMLLGHTRRLRNFPHHIANKAEDLVINAKLSISYPAKWTKTLSEVGLGFKPGEAEKYAALAEETVARMLMIEEEKKKKEEEEKKQQQGGGQGNQKQQGGQGNQQQQGGGQGQQQQGGKGNQKGQGGQGQQQPGGQQGGGQNQGQGGQDKQQGKGGNEKGEGDGKWSDQHTVPLEDLIKIFEDNGLHKQLEQLQLPGSDDIEKIGQIEETTKMKDIEAIEKASAQRNQIGGKYPGSHIVDAAAERIANLREGKLDWKLGIKNEILGGGLRYKKTDDEADLIFYVDAADMGIPNEIYVGADLPHSPEEAVLCLLDTSGSVDPQMMREFISEVLTLKKGVSGVADTASEVILLSADTVLRGEAIEINDSNVDDLMAKGVDVFGGGGTDLQHSLVSAMRLPLVKEKKIKSVVYFTDLCDHIPEQKKFQEWLDEGVVFAFITTPHYMQEEFVKGVKNWARVYPVEKGIEVDLTEDSLKNPVNTRANKI